MTMLRRAALLLGFVLIAVGLFSLSRRGEIIYAMSEGKTLTAFLGVVAVALAVYELCMLGIIFIVRVRKGAPSEINMLGGLVAAAAVLVVLLQLLHFYGKLSGSLAAIAAFAGLLVGWSLQAPVSGLAAWVLVNLYRPFRVGDRVMLPAWGMTGDVTQIGMMYTVLNQVGGTVGSEEAANRDVLIPNAMLFGNVIINYTPQQAAAYVLDEVIVRITHSSNWELAEKVSIEAAKKVTREIIEATGQEPYIRADMYDYGVYMRLRYMTAAKDRPRIASEITRQIFDAFQAYPDLDFAIPYIYSHRAGRRAGARHLEMPRDEEAALTELNVQQVHDVTGVGQNPENASHVRELAKEIAEHGLLQPIIVEKREDGQYNIVAGHLRLEACKMLGWDTVPSIVRTPHDTGTP